MKNSWAKAFSAVGLVLLLIEGVRTWLSPALFMDEGYYVGASLRLLRGDLFFTNYSYDKPYAHVLIEALGIALGGKTPIGFKLSGSVLYGASYLLFLKISRSTLSRSMPSTPIASSIEAATQSRIFWADFTVYLLATGLFCLPIMIHHGFSAFAEPVLMFFCLAAVHEIIRAENQSLRLTRLSWWMTLPALLAFWLLAFIAAGFIATRAPKAWKNQREAFIFLWPVLVQAAFLLSIRGERVERYCFIFLPQVLLLMIAGFYLFASLLQRAKILIAAGSVGVGTAMLMLSLNSNPAVAEERGHFSPESGRLFSRIVQTVPEGSSVLYPTQHAWEMAPWIQRAKQRFVSCKDESCLQRTRVGQPIFDRQFSVRQDGAGLPHLERAPLVFKAPNRPSGYYDSADRPN